MATTVTTITVDQIELTCHACGTTGTLTAQTGDICERITIFATQHLDPHVVRLHVTGNGVDLGWAGWEALRG